jgi:hypothetical protein
MKALLLLALLATAFAINIDSSSNDILHRLQDTKWGQVIYAMAEVAEAA